MSRDHETQRMLRRIERKQDVIIAGLAQIVKLDTSLLNQERDDTMAIKDVIAKLQVDVRDNKDAADAVQKALQTYAQANSDLTDKLKVALANVAEETDVTALSDLVTQLEANNNELHAAAPATAAAVVENTGATA